ncbi:terminase large subunit [Rhodospira trueperi]|uniref:Phage terminase-like protein, large subunit, contains N-terminal HTH domain n=1 Tax=Rhodospira trueperi TaxID=69960 RepID=A0A1G6X1G6_9PROT|nr:terminase TerL endonuclease subunit [Rhodospira trueperi]SDD71874.1 Phage terminase-like protein, large subunit, contains N-terminal HTH domain [Rhodospira trueperi]
MTTPATDGATWWTVDACRPAWLFDDSDIPDPHGKGARAVAFVERLTITEGPRAGQRLGKVLARWQRRLIRRVYGDTLPDGRRRFSDVAVWLPRGNGKTTLIAALGLLHLLGPERDAAGQVVVAAADRGQASIGFGHAKRYVEADRTLSRIVRAVESQKELHHPKSGSVLKAISHESYTKHGLNISLLIGDEIHAWPAHSGRELWRVLRTSMGKRADPLTITISTAGVGRNTLAWDRWQHSRAVAKGEREDESFLPVIFAAPDPPEGEDLPWQDEALWHALNPALGAFLYLDELRKLARQAAPLPHEVEGWQQLHLNRWIDGSVAGWVAMTSWDRGADPVDLDAMEGRPAWIGVDLSSTTDLTAVVLAVPDDDGGVDVVPFCFVPADNIRRRQEVDGVPYPAWADSGLLTATPGNVVDYAAVEACIIDLCERFNVQEVAMDQWNATGSITRLQDAGVPVTTHRQGFVSMSPPMKDTERLILSGKIRHGGHPVLRWCVANVVPDKDPAGNIKPSKARAKERIDAAGALIMAVGRAVVGEGGSVYDDEDARPEGLLIL